LIFFVLEFIVLNGVINLLINFKLQKIGGMKEEISVSLFQPELVWEDIDANLDMLNKMVAQVPEGADLLLLPETFSTGFTMQAAHFAEEVDGKAVTWMKRVARERNLVIAGSLILREGGRIFNRLFWIGPEGIEGTYDKRHLFRMGREDEHFVPGNSRPVFELEGFRFLPQICYDLRFPVFCRNRDDYDVLFYVANWPAPRQLVWESLTRARAIENQAYVLGVNRVGMDGVGVDHLGGTCAFDPMGNTLQIMGDREGIITVTLMLEKVREFRQKFPVWKDADRFSLDGIKH
jgi:predicted amidohydrolase